MGSLDRNRATWRSLFHAKNGCTHTAAISERTRPSTPQRQHNQHGVPCASNCAATPAQQTCKQDDHIQGDPAGGTPRTTRRQNRGRAQWLHLSKSSIQDIEKWDMKGLQLWSETCCIHSCVKLGTWLPCSRATIACRSHVCALVCQHSCCTQCYTGTPCYLLVYRRACLRFLC